MQEVSSQGQHDEQAQNETSKSVKELAERIFDTLMIATMHREKDGEALLPILTHFADEQRRAGALEVAVKHVPSWERISDGGYVQGRAVCSCGLVADGVTRWEKLWTDHIAALSPAPVGGSEK